jgi:hypothetical protein
MAVDSGQPRRAEDNALPAGVPAPANYTPNALLPGVDNAVDPVAVRVARVLRSLRGGLVVVVVAACECGPSGRRVVGYRGGYGGSRHERDEYSHSPCLSIPLSSVTSVDRRHGIRAHVTAQSL